PIVCDVDAAGSGEQDNSPLVKPPSNVDCGAAVDFMVVGASGDESPQLTNTVVAQSASAESAKRTIFMALPVIGTSGESCGRENDGEGNFRALCGTHVLLVTSPTT